MRFAETTGRRSLVVLATLTAGTVIAASWPCDAPRTTSTHRKRVHAMRGCQEALKARTPVVPQVAPAPSLADEPVNGYVAALRSAREPLTACIQDQTATRFELVLSIPPTGKIDLEVTARAENLATVDMGVIKCIEAAIQPIEFPRSDKLVRLSTYLTP